MKKLLDLIIEKGFEKSYAKILIRAGKIFVNHQEVFTPSAKVKDGAIIEIKLEKKYVSRGAYKLLKGLNYFNLSVEKKTCLDIGSSAGGFSQVLLEKGAKNVYALDSGTNQLDYKLRISEKIIALEKTNLKTIKKAMFENELDLIVCDVSFISLKKVFTVLEFLKPGTDLILLIKPQYEANSNSVLKNGIVSESKHPFIINKVKEYNSEEFEMMGVVKSPILGKKSKNIEYISHFKKR